MTETHVERSSLEQIFGDKTSTTYDVPLYQREYAWGETEIHQLLDDLWEAYTRNPKRNYYLGTLVVFSQRGGVLELIDGQQRLTTLSLIYKLLNPSSRICRVTFSNRDSSIEFLTNFFFSENPWRYVPTAATPQSFREALSAIRDYRYTAGDDRCGRGGSLCDLLELQLGGDSFRDFILHKLQLFIVTMPFETDVSSYFEVMNNRGKQLEPHEIIKEQLVAKLYEQAKDSDNVAIDQLATRFDAFWSACSNMNGHLILRMHGCLDFENNPDATWRDCGIECDVSESDKEDYDEYRSVIDDFPNFLLHVLRLYVKKLGSVPDEIPLDDRQLSNVFQDQMSCIDPADFLNLLIRTRLKFDRYVVKASFGEDGAVKAWTLQHAKNHKGKFYLIDTFGDKDVPQSRGQRFGEWRARLIRVESMLQVTYRTRRYKDWLYQVLDADTIDFSEPANLVVFLENYARGRLLDVITPEGSNPFCRGCSTPHVLFNAIDYLLWRRAYLSGAFDSDTSASNLGELCKVEKFVNDDFVFAYRSSIEHHHPQQQYSDDGASGTWNGKYDVDDIGNLCIVYPNENSSLNNRSPKDKADHQKQSGRVTPPKQRWMYKQTIKDETWKVSEMRRQSKVVRDIVNNFCYAPERAHKLVKSIVAEANCTIAETSMDFRQLDSRACDEKGGCEIIVKKHPNFRHGLRIWFGFEEHDWRKCFVGVYSSDENARELIASKARELCKAFGLRNSSDNWPSWINLDDDANWDDTYLSNTQGDDFVDRCVVRISNALRIIVEYAISLEKALDDELKS